MVDSFVFDGGVVEGFNVGEFISSYDNENHVAIGLCAKLPSQFYDSVNLKTYLQILLEVLQKRKIYLSGDASAKKI